MAKKTQQLEELVDLNIVQEELADSMDARFTKYAFTVLEDRALPDARDGLKPSQRRILVAMNDLKLHPGGGTEKCAKICGDTSGNYHPHGEAIVYPTLCRLVQSWAMRYPLLQGQGNFGNIDGDAPAAMRYTESKLSRYGESMLSELTSDVVPFVANYNEKRQEPTILPATFPNLLVNGCEGIAVGWATKMLPHNLREVVAAIKLYIDNPSVKPEKLLKVMPGPDFPTGGKLLGQEGVLEYYKTGRGKISLEGVYEIQRDGKGNTSIVVTEVPFQASPDKLCVEIRNLVEGDKESKTPPKITGISDLKNLSSKATGIKVVIEIDKKGNPELVLNSLLKMTCLRKSFTVNNTVLIDGKVVPEASLIDLIKAFVEHRQLVLTRKFEAELVRTKARIHILEGLLGILNKLDAVIKLIRTYEGENDQLENELVAQKFVKTVAQAKAVLAITLRQLTKLEGKKLLDEKNKLDERVKWLDNVLGCDQEILNLIVEEQEELADKFGDKRRTLLEEAATDIADEDLIKDEQLMISLTGDGYIRSVIGDNFRVQSRGGSGSMAVSKSDVPENIFEMFETSAKQLVLFFTNKGQMYQRRAFEIPQASKTGKGLHSSNLLQLEAGEFVTNMATLKNMEQPGHIVLVTKNGLIKKSEISEYNTTRRTGLTAIGLNAGDEARFACVTDGKRDVFIVTKKGYCVRYNEKIVPIQGRGTKGSRALKLETHDAVAQVFTLAPKELPDIMVVTEGGFGKKTSAEEYKTLTNRNVKGYSVIKKSALAQNGEIIGACAMDKNDTLLVLTSSGKSIRLDPKDVRDSGRTTKGVRIVKLDSNEKVVKIAKLSLVE